MNVETKTARTIFLEAIENHLPEQRPAFLDAACGGDPELRREVLRLLEAHGELDQFMARPAAGQSVTIDLAPCESVGATIGHYKLMEQIGEGGMGIVFVAEQSQPVRRKVALKVIKPGMDSRQVIARFEAERQALAMMDHPNIARILDAGATNSGHPYFAMELVRGLPITDYCDKAKLIPRHRLELFVTVCQAVQHAHQKGIIHRDLKPSNVLVTLHDGTPVPKVIDFGVAKAVNQQLTERPIYTGFSQMIGTPLYMSPEQAEMSGLDIDTRSDVYSLGVLLYELLIGETPFDGPTLKEAGYDEMRRIIREDEPMRPSDRVSTMGPLSRSTLSQKRGLDERRLGQMLRGELDCIVMKALEKDRDRRYETASGLARDIERFLADEPVEARPPSTRYRLGKFVRRNKVPVVAAGALLAALLAGVIGTTWGLVRATEAEGVSQQRLEEAEAAWAKAERAEADTLAHFRASTNEAIEQLIGSKPELGAKEKTYLEKTLKRWQEFAARQGSDERSQAIRGEGHLRVGLLWGRLGRRAEARTEYQAAQNLYKRLVEKFPAVREYQGDLALTHNNLGLLLAGLGKSEEARAEYQAAQNLFKRLVEKFPAVREYQQQLARTHNNLGLLLATLGESEAARAEYQAARDLQKRLVEQFPAVPEYQGDLARTHNNLGMLLATLGESEAARAEYQAARDLLQRLVEQFPGVPEYQKQLANTQHNLGYLLANLGKSEEARAEYQAARDLQKWLVEQFPGVPENQQELARTHNNLGILLARLGKTEEAREEWQSARDLQKWLVEQFPGVPENQQQLAFTHNNLGVLLAGLGKSEEARAEYQAARDLGKRLVEQFPGVPVYQQQLAKFHNNLANLLGDLGKSEEARAELQSALICWKKLVESFPGMPAYQEGLADTHTNLGALLFDLGESEESRAEGQSARDIQKKLVEQFPAVPAYQIKLGCSYFNYGVLIREGGRPAESLEWFDLAIRTLQPVHDQEPREVTAREFLRNSHWARAAAYDQLRRPAEADNDWVRAIELSPPAEQPESRAARATSQLRAGRVAEAVDEVAELTKDPNWNAGRWYDFACVYSVASGSIADKQQEYADRAMELLTKAVAAGWKDAHHIAQDTDLDRLRNRDDFQELVAKLSAEPPITP